MRGFRLVSSFLFSSVCKSSVASLKFTDFKSGYHERTIEGINIQLDNSPIEVSSDYKTLLNTVNNNID